MILALLLAAAGQSAAPQWYVEGEPPSADAVLAMVEECGVSGAEVSFDDLLQSDAVTLPNDSLLNDTQLTCLAQAEFETDYWFHVAEPYRGRFFQIREDVAAPWDRELAIENLAKIGKLNGRPVRKPTETDSEFSLRLEQHCESPGALSSEYGPYVLAPSFFTDAEGKLGDEGQKLECLMSAAALAGVLIGFIGNDMSGEEAAYGVDSPSGH